METTEDEIVGWYHRLNGHGFETIPGDGEGEGNILAQNTTLSLLFHHHPIDFVIVSHLNFSMLS